MIGTYGFGTYRLTVQSELSTLIPVTGTASRSLPHRCAKRWLDDGSQTALGFQTNQNISKPETRLKLAHLTLLWHTFDINYILQGSTRWVSLFLDHPFIGESLDLSRSCMGQPTCQRPGIRRGSSNDGAAHGQLDSFGRSQRQDWVETPRDLVGTWTSRRTPWKKTLDLWKTFMFIHVIKLTTYSNWAFFQHFKANIWDGFPWWSWWMKWFTGGQLR